jgi:calcineurin-like phosphoesterase
VTAQSPRAGLGNPPNGNAPRPGGACRILMIGDIIGKPGRIAIEQVLPELRDERGVDFVTANGENVAGGMGLTPSTAEALYAAGVDVITSGNHIWDKREIYPFLDASDRVLRPLNYGTHGVPGRGWGTYHALDGTEIAVVNLQGRTHMQPIDNPFTDADRLMDEASEPLPPVRIVDFHSRPRRPRWASTSTVASRPSSARTRTWSPATSGSCPRGRPTRRTSA